MTALTGFTACCGADVISGFEDDPKGSYGGDRRYDPIQGCYVTTPNARTFEQVFRESLAKQKTTYKAGGRMFCCILTEPQLEKWGAIIKSEGFEPVRRWTNAGHGDPYYLYLFVLCTDEKGRCNGDFTLPPKGWESITVEPKVLVPQAVKKPEAAPAVPRPREAPRFLRF